MEDFKENFDSNQEALNLEIPVNGDLNGLSSTPVPRDHFPHDASNSFEQNMNVADWKLQQMQE